MAFKLLYGRRDGKEEGWRRDGKIPICPSVSYGMNDGNWKVVVSSFWYRKEKQKEIKLQFYLIN